MNVNLLQSWLYRKAREHGLQIFHKTETGPTNVWGGSLPPTSCASRALNGLWLCFTWSILISPSHPIPRTVAFLQLTRCRSNDPDLLYPICDKYATTFFFKNAHWSLDSLVLNRRPNHTCSRSNSPDDVLISIPQFPVHCCCHSPEFISQTARFSHMQPLYGMISSWRLLGCTYQTTKRCNIIIVVMSSRGILSGLEGLPSSFRLYTVNPNPMYPLLSENSRPWDKKWDEIQLANRGLCPLSFGAPIAANTGCKISLIAVPALGGLDLHLVATPGDLKRSDPEILQHYIIVESRTVAASWPWIWITLSMSGIHHSLVSFVLNYCFTHPDHKKSFLGIIPTPSTCPQPFLIIKVSGPNANKDPENGPGEPKSHHARPDRSIPPPTGYAPPGQISKRFTDEDWENAVWSYDFLDLVGSFDRPSATEDGNVHVSNVKYGVLCQLGSSEPVGLRKSGGWVWEEEWGISCSAQRMGPCI